MGAVTLRTDAIQTNEESSICNSDAQVKGSLEGRDFEDLNERIKELDPESNGNAAGCWTLGCLAIAVASLVVGVWASCLLSVFEAPILVVVATLAFPTAFTALVGAYFGAICLD